MVSTQKKKHQQKKQFSQLNSTLGDFAICNCTNVSAIENGTLESQINGQYNDFERIADSVSQNQVIGTNIGDKIRNAADSAIMTV